MSPARPCLRDSDIDIAYCHSEGVQPADDLEVTPLRSEELVIVMRPADNASARSTITLDELLELPFIGFRPGAAIHEALVSLFAVAGREPQIWFQSADVATAFALVKRGLGVALVPRSAASLEPTISVLSLAPSPLMLHVTQVQRRDRPRSLALVAFADQARSALNPGVYGPGNWL